MAVHLLFAGIIKVTTITVISKEHREQQLIPAEQHL